MNAADLLGLRWLRFRLLPEAGADRRGHPPLRVACPHCTNVDTLERHCRNLRCDWVRCTCGALVYDRRRHRHPRHGSTPDTCHDPAEAL